MISRKLPTKLWAGFCNGKMDIEPYVGGTGAIYGVLYRTRRAARELYQDVRRVEVRAVKQQRYVNCFSTKEKS